MRMNKLIYILILCSIFFVSASHAQRCNDSLAYDGFEDVASMGIDSTGNYWILTQPTEGYYRLIVNGIQSEQYQNIKHLTFSPDGKKWAFFAKDNVTWYLITNDKKLEIYCDNVVNLGFSPNSEVIYYVYLVGSEHHFVIGNKTIKATGAIGDVYLSYGAERFAIGIRRGGMTYYQLQGWETPQYDDIKPVGFWNDGSFIYIVKIGDSWEIYKDRNSISERFWGINDYAINLTGTVAGFLVRRSQNTSAGVLLSDDYYEPLITKSYESVSSLALHPHIPLMAFKAMDAENYYIVMSNTEYAGGRETGTPKWTHDGSQLFFSGCATDCFVNVNGRRFNLFQMFDMLDNFVMKPGSNTIAYSTSSSFIVRYLETKELVAGKMVDYIITPIYSWRHNAYMTLGLISNRVYLMQCRI